MARKFPPDVMPTASRILTSCLAYCQQLRCRDVKGLSRKEYEQRDKQHVGMWTRVPMTILSSGAEGRLRKTATEGAWLESAGFAFRLRRDMGFIPNA